MKNDSDCVAQTFYFYYLYNLKLIKNMVTIIKQLFYHVNLLLCVISKNVCIFIRTVAMVHFCLLVGQLVGQSVCMFIKICNFGTILLRFISKLV